METNLKQNRLKANSCTRLTKELLRNNRVYGGYYYDQKPKGYVSKADKITFCWPLSVF